MNAKYCKLIRKLARSWDLSPKMAKSVKKEFLKSGITTPETGLIMEVMEQISESMKKTKM